MSPDNTIDTHQQTSCLKNMILRVKKLYKFSLLNSTIMTAWSSHQCSSVARYMNVDQSDEWNIISSYLSIHFKLWHKSSREILQYDTCWFKRYFNRRIAFVRPIQDVLDIFAMNMKFIAVSHGRLQQDANRIRKFV